MAKQKGPAFYTGTMGGITFYRMDGKYYQRRKSTLSGKRVKRDPAFKLTMVYAGWLGQASQLAVAIYRSLPRAQRKHALYRRLTGMAMQLLKQEMDAELIKMRLQEACGVKEERMGLVKVQLQEACVVKEQGMEMGLIDTAPGEAAAVKEQRTDATLIKTELPDTGVAKEQHMPAPASAVARPVKTMRITAKRRYPPNRSGIPAGKLWITGKGVLGQLSVHIGDLHHESGTVGGGRCLVPG